MRSAALAVHFEAGDLFVLAHIEGFKSFNEAQRTLMAAPRLFFSDDRLFIAYSGAELHALFSSEDYSGLDECGRWHPGADRASLEDGWAAQLSVPAFMALRPNAARFRPVWAAVQEWESGADGRFIRIIASASGSIDTLALLQ